MRSIAALGSEEESESDAHIDVSFDITRYGKAARIRILNATTSVKRADRRDLVRLIRGSSFRPRVIDGQIADSSTVVIRY